VSELRKAMESDDLASIQSARSALEQASHQFAERIYQQAAQQQPGGQGPSDGEAGPEGATQGGASGEKVYDADYEVVDDDKK